MTPSITLNVAPEINRGGMKRRTKQTGRISWERTDKGWVAIFPTPRGERRINTGTLDKREATRMAKPYKRLVKLGVAFDRKAFAALTGAKNVKLSKAIEEWKDSRLRAGAMQERTVHNYVIYLNRFARDVGMDDEAVAAVTEEHVSDWVNGPDAGKASTRTVKLSILKEFFDWCVSSGKSTGNPARALGKINMSKLGFSQKEVRHKIPFNDDEVNALIRYIDRSLAKEKMDMDAIDCPLWEDKPMSKGYNIAERIEKLKFWKSAILIGRWAGLRIGDIAGLEFDSLAKPGVLVVWTDKRDRRVEIPLNEPLAAALASIERKSEQQQFCFPKQRELNAGPNRASLPKQFESIMTRAGVRDRSFHCLRATFAIDAVDRLVAAGRTREQAVRDVADLLGHSSTRTTEQHYLVNA